MLGKRQFSLSYLLLEVFWFALAMGFTRQLVWGDSSAGYDSGFFIFSTLFCWGTAVSGLLGKMFNGALWTSIVLTVIFIVF
jgi:hypothetical protein